MTKFKYYKLEAKNGINYYVKAENLETAIKGAEKKLNISVEDYMEIEFTLIPTQRKNFYRVNLDAEAKDLIDKLAKEQKLTKSELIKKLVNND